MSHSYVRLKGKFDSTQAHALRVNEVANFGELRRPAVNDHASLIKLSHAIKISFPSRRPVANGRFVAGRLLCYK